MFFHLQWRLWEWGARARLAGWPLPSAPLKCPAWGGLEGNPGPRRHGGGTYPPPPGSLPLIVQSDWAFVAGAQAGDSQGPGLIMCLTSGQPPSPQGGRLTWLPAVQAWASGRPPSKDKGPAPFLLSRPQNSCWPTEPIQEGSGGPGGLLSPALMAQKSPGGLLSSLLPLTQWRRWRGRGELPEGRCRNVVSLPGGGPPGSGPCLPPLTKAGWAP